MALLVSLALRKRYGLSGVPSDEDLWTVCQGEGLTIVDDWPFAGRLREVYCDGVLGLRRGLTHELRRWLIAHGLMHHMAHVGNHLYSGMPTLLISRQERMAELGAGYLFWGHLSQTTECWHPGINSVELADLVDVPESCVKRWHALLQGWALDVVGHSHHTRSK